MPNVVFYNEDGSYTRPQGIVLFKTLKSEWINSSIQSHSRMPLACICAYIPQFRIYPVCVPYQVYHAAKCILVLLYNVVLCCDALILFHVDPCNLQFSKSSRELYFYNDTTQKSVYEAPPDSDATYQYVLWTVQCYIVVNT